MYVHSDIIIRSVEYTATLICFGLECSVANLNEEARQQHKATYFGVIRGYGELEDFRGRLEKTLTVHHQNTMTVPVAQTTFNTKKNRTQALRMFLFHVTVVTRCLDVLITLFVCVCLFLKPLPSRCKQTSNKHETAHSG